MSIPLPIVVDLDGTLTPTDTLVESIILLIKKSPFNLFRLALWLLGGRAKFKDAIARNSSFSASGIVYNAELLDYLQQEKDKGRQLILATASHQIVAEKVALHLGIFSKMLFTQGGVNLKGATKLAAIQQHVGPDFVYAGDSTVDLPIWRQSKAAILVGVRDGVRREVANSTPVEREFPKAPAGLKPWLRALRVHQWVKNALLFVPLLTAFSFTDTAKIATLILAFFSLSFSASATYIVNDLWDLQSDRAHPRKRKRPFASSQLSIAHGIMVSALLLAMGLILAASLTNVFFGVVLAYVVSTSLYSWVLKQYVLIDVLMLSFLYTLRIIAGSIAVQIPMSSWLLAFSGFIFFSLALVKRCAELVTHDSLGVSASRGRDYRVSDLAVLWPLGIGSALSATVVFGLFISAPETQSRYATPQLLWLITACLVYWLGRLWIKTSRGEMHDDPVVYAIKDRGSRVTVGSMILIAIVAHFVSITP